MISTWSTVWATSASTWLEINTVPRRSANRRMNVRNSRGVEPVRRLVEDEQLGVAEQGTGEAEPLAHAKRVPPHHPVGRLRELDELQHLLDADRRDPCRKRGHTQVIAARASGVKIVRLEHRADLLRRLLKVPVAAAKDEGVTRGGLGEPHQQP